MKQIAVLGLSRFGASVARSLTAMGVEVLGVDNDPERVAEKVLYWHELFRPERLLLQLSVGTLPHARGLRAIELLGTEVLPRVERALRPPAGG